MALAITNNIASLTAQDNLSRTSKSLSSTLEKLSSGLKINRGADGPAALVISEEQRAQISGLQAAINNSSKAVSLVQTTEGALNEINSLLVKIRGLALDSANSGVNDSNAQAANQAEVSNALETIDRIAQTTQFGTKKVLDGSAGLTGASTNPSNVSVLKTTSAAAVGAYQVNVTQAAQQAQVTAGIPQVGNTANAETLTINGVQINIAAGTNQNGVLNAINSQTSQTGVVAEVFNNAGKQSNTSTGAAATVISGTAFTVGGAAAAGGTQLHALDQHTGGVYAAADTIAFSGTKADGTAVNGTYTFTGAADTVANFLTQVQTSFGAGYTAELTRDGNIEVRNGTPGTSAISISIGTQTTASGGSINFGTFNSNNVTSSTPVDSTLTLNSLAQSNGKYGTGDSLDISGTRADSTTFNVASGVTVTANTKVSDVVNALQTQFGTGYTVSFTGGKFTVIDNKDANASNVAFNITDHAGNVGSGGALFGAGTSTTNASALRLHTTEYGSAATISVQSNQVGGGTTTGIGTGILTGTGVDIAGNIGGYTATGQGNVLIGNASDKAAGIAVAVVGKDSTYDTQTVTGNNLSTVTVQNNSLIFQIGANASQTASIAVDNASTSALGLGVSGDQFTNLSQINIVSQSGAQDALKVIDQAISDISNLRGRLGAFQANTLESTTADLQTTLENTTSAESTIRDTDFAAETANYTKYQVLVQAGTSVLSNANQTSQLVLSLLQKL
jgi:flagellin